MQKTAISFTKRSAVLSRLSSARQPDFRILWNTSIFQRRAYQRSFSTAAPCDRTGKSVISFQSIGGRGALPGLDHREPPAGTALLLADGWQNANTAVLDFDSRDLGTALAVANLNLMHALDTHFIHLVGHRVMTITRTTVDAAPDDEVGAELLGRAEQLVDVALAITNVDAAGRRTEHGHGLAQVLQPAEALLGLDGHARRIDLALERGGALELLPRPELHG